MRIGFFDSGIGGLSLLKQAVKTLPDADFWYIADQKFFPYGELRPEQLLRRAHALTQELIQQGCQSILIACNTATAHCIDALRKEYALPFVGIEPFIKAKQRILHTSPQAKIAVLMTKAMLSSQRYQKLYQTWDTDSQIQAFACEKLATEVENLFHRQSTENIDWESLLNELKPLQTQSFDHLILGCTHYPLIQDKIAEYLDVVCLSPCSYVIEQLKKVCPLQKIISPPYIHFKSTQQSEWKSWDHSDFLQSLASYRLPTERLAMPRKPV